MFLERIRSLWDVFSSDPYFHLLNRSTGPSTRISFWCSINSNTIRKKKKYNIYYLHTCSKISIFPNEVACCKPVTYKEKDIKFRHHRYAVYISLILCYIMIINLSSVISLWIYTSTNIRTRAGRRLSGTRWFRYFALT